MVFFGFIFHEIKNLILEYFMKILFVIDSFFTGGAEFSTLEIVRYLKENGIQISVCKLKNKEPQYDASLFGLDISDVFTLPTGGFWTKRKALQKSIQEFKPDIIHTHTAKAGFLGRLASLISTNRAMRVHTFHGHLLHGYFGRFKLSLIINAERILGIFTHQLLAVGVRVRQDLLDVRIGTPEKFVVMPPGVSIGELPSKSQSKVDFGLQDGMLICALIGRVTQIKRPDRYASERLRTGLA